MKILNKVLVDELPESCSCPFNRDKWCALLMCIQENRISSSNFVQNYRYKGMRHPDCPLRKSVNMRDIIPEILEEL